MRIILHRHPSPSLEFHTPQVLPSNFQEFLFLELATLSTDLTEQTEDQKEITVTLLLPQMVTLDFFF